MSTREASVRYTTVTTVTTLMTIATLTTIATVGMASRCRLSSGQSYGDGRVERARQVTIVNEFGPAS